MVQLKIKNKWISLGGSSYVTDMDDNEIYKVKGKVFTFTNKKYFYDKDGKLLFIIRNKFWRLFTRRAFVLDPDGNVVCRVSKKYLSIRSKFMIDQYKDQILIDGNVFDYNYNITENGKDIGHISRKISLRDSFVLTIEDESKAAFYCALVIAIDCILDRRNAQHSSSNSNNWD